MRYKESDLHLDLYSSLTSVSNLNLLTLLLGNVLVSQNLMVVIGKRVQTSEKLIDKPKQELQGD